jgi:hypothetical protein
MRRRLHWRGRCPDGDTATGFFPTVADLIAATERFIEMERRLHPFT